MSELTDAQRDAIEDAILAMENSGWTRSRDASLSVLRAIITAHDGWISVADRLPEKYEEVIVWPHPGDYCMTGQLQGSGWTYGEYDRDGAQTVPMRDRTHWMPLPKAPASTTKESAT